jgi:6-phosphogluconate dehydrogenase
MPEIGLVGLGRMGGNMTARLRGRGHRVVVFDRAPGRAQAVAQETGAQAASSIAELVAALRPPRAVWAMVPAAVTEAVIDDIGRLLEAGDVVIDGGNSNYRDSVRRARALAARRVVMLDCGTSGGIWGLTEGYCLMVGGDDAAAVARLAPVFADLAPPEGWLHVGPSGAGHFSKMVHNGIEYGLMQAYAEGFELLRASEFRYDLGRLAALWGRGSVVRSWLLELLTSALKKDADLAGIRGYVEDSGEGRWTVEEALARAVPTPVLMLALQMRFRSRQEQSFAAKVCAALRAEFGGHAVKKS